MRTSLALVAVALVALLALTPAVAAPQAVVTAQAAGETPPFEIIVNPDIPAVVLDRKFIEDAFLKKVTRWPDGTALHPADLTPGSPVRKRFSEEILNRSVEAVWNYWQQRIFSGRDVPPPELNDDDEAAAFVLKHSGGIAYVSPRTKLNGAKVVTWR
ncbi:MAG TPA: hypothetical protein VHV30_01800 [Polyangiaceae bacterium]|jgi:hypothetical protein|nr:hypothetical protein [Polyangiaceae bacterium]